MLTEKQRLERINGIGGSDAAAVCGLSKWKTPIDVFLEKTGKKELDILENEAIYWGNVLEPVVAHEYSRRTGKKLEQKTTFLHPVYSFMLGNIDYYISEENAILECKTSSHYSLDEWGEEYTDEMPQEYLLQCAHYAIVADVKYVDLAVLIGGNNFRIYRYIRDKEFEEVLILQEKNFWDNHVLKDIAPPPITEQDIKNLYPQHTKDKFISANEGLITSINALKEIKNLYKKIEENEESLKMQIQSEMKDSEFIKDDQGKVLASWKTQEQKTLDVKLLEREMPEIYKKYLRQNSFRKFLLKK